MILPFVLENETDMSTTKLIKVIGVGGGGSNAVNYMYQQGIYNVAFAVCNTDGQALRDSPVPYQLRLGPGLGAGGDPHKARQIAEADLEPIRKMLQDGTKMVFITAGMGGGTGTGVAPIIAREAKKLDILTVGIVTIPFRHELSHKINIAIDGVEEMAKHVDALLIINNEELRTLYRDLPFANAEAKADEVLCTAVKSIAEIITKSAKQNADFNDVRTVLKDGGVAIMNMAYAEGEHRLEKALNAVLHSPLLNNKDFFEAQKLLIAIHSPAEEDQSPLITRELEELEAFMQKFTKKHVETKISYGYDSGLGSQIKVILLASGFGNYALPGFEEELLHKEEQRNREAAEKEEELRRRIEAFYPDTGRKSAQTYRTYIFRDHDLDNPDIISAVSESPTYNRTSSTKGRILRRSDEALSQCGQDLPYTRPIPAPTVTPAKEVAANISFTLNHEDLAPE